MTMAVSTSSAFILEAGIRVRPIGGETVAGDAAITVGPTTTRRTLAAMIDGLGHGVRAAEAAQTCVSYVEKNPDVPLGELFSQLHRELLKTRGAVVSIARISPADAKVEFAGVGNITAVLFRPKASSVRHVHPLTVPGVLGSAFRSVRVQDFPFTLGDMVIMHSDGIRPSFDLSRLAPMTAQEAADDIMRAHAKSTDDAGVVVVRGVTTKAKLTAPPPANMTAFLPEERIPVRGPGDAECLAVATRGYTEKLGLDPKSRWGCSIAASELATNVLKFAGHGTAVLSLVTEPRKAFRLEVIDEGAGIANLAAAMEDGFSEGARLTADRPRHAGQGLGVGLGSVQRLMDSVEVFTQEGRGTRIVALKYLR